MICILDAFCHYSEMQMQNCQTSHEYKLKTQNTAHTEYVHIKDTRETLKPNSVHTKLNFKTTIVDVLH